MMAQDGRAASQQQGQNIAIWACLFRVCHIQNMRIHLNLNGMLFLAMLLLCYINVFKLEVDAYSTLALCIFLNSHYEHNFPHYMWIECGVHAWLHFKRCWRWNCSIAVLQLTTNKTHFPPESFRLPWDVSIMPSTYLPTFVNSLYTRKQTQDLNSHFFPDSHLRGQHVDLQHPSLPVWRATCQRYCWIYRRLMRSPWSAATMPCQVNSTETYRNETCGNVSLFWNLQSN